MMQLIDQGGPVMYGILLCSVVAAWLFLTRLLELHRSQIKTGDFLKGVFNVVSRGNVAEAVSICEETPGPVARMMRAAVLRRAEGLFRAECAMRETAVAEVPRMERLVPMLQAAGHVASGLGLLGTILGMMSLAKTMATGTAGPVASADLELGLWRALVCAASGLAVAIPAYAGSQLLTSRVEAIVLDMERAYIEIVLFLQRLEKGEDS